MEKRKMKDEQEEGSFCVRHVRDPCSSFSRRCRILVREQRARFYILRRCIVMLVCWRDHGAGDP